MYFSLHVITEESEAGICIRIPERILGGIVVAERFLNCRLAKSE